MFIGRVRRTDAKIPVHANPVTWWSAFPAIGKLKQSERLFFLQPVPFLGEVTVSLTESTDDDDKNVPQAD